MHVQERGYCQRGRDRAVHHVQRCQERQYPDMWMLGVISAIDSDKMDTLCRRMLEYDQEGIWS